MIQIPWRCLEPLKTLHQEVFGRPFTPILTFGMTGRLGPLLSNFGPWNKKMKNLTFFPLKMSIPPPKKIVRLAIGWIKQRKDALENWHPASLLFASFQAMEPPIHKFFALTMLKAILQQLNKCIYYIYINLQSYKIHYPSNINII